MRLSGSNTGMGIQPYVVHENYVEAKANPVTYNKGQVRSFQQIEAIIKLGFLGLPIIPEEADFEYNFQYFPFSFQIA